MTERGPEAQQKRLLDLIDNPEKDVPVQVYRDHLKAASQAVQRAHKAVMAAWAK